jgi:hypothetical protein
VTFIRRPVGAALAIALGVVALVVGASLLLLRDGGWPWHAAIAATPGAATATAEIIADDGTAYRFSGSPAQTQAWLDSKQDELKDAHGIPAKIAAGRVLQPVGLVLVLAGLARLLMLARRRRSAPPAVINRV